MRDIIGAGKNELPVACLFPSEQLFAAPVGTLLDRVILGVLDVLAVLFCFALVPRFARFRNSNSLMLCAWLPSRSVELCSGTKDKEWTSSASRSCCEIHHYSVSILPSSCKRRSISDRIAKVQPLTANTFCPSLGKRKKRRRSRLRPSYSLCR